MTDQNGHAMYSRTLLLDDGLPSPYGGKLVQAFVSVAERQEVHGNLPQLKRVNISARELLDLEMIASGAYSPLTGYMTSQVYNSVLESMRYLAVNLGVCRLRWR